MQYIKFLCHVKYFVVLNCDSTEVSTQSINGPKFLYVKNTWSLNINECALSVYNKSCGIYTVNKINHISTDISVE